MKNDEFKARQAWLPFVDAVGIVLQVLEPVKKAAWDWFAQWKKDFITKTIKPQSGIQLPLPFESACRYTI